MLVLFMLVQVSTGGECRATQVAGVGALSCVRSLVVSHGGTTYEATVAPATNKRPLASVTTFVFHVGAVVSESTVACLAFEGLLTRVYPPMLIYVCFSSEHFAAVLTLESLLVRVCLFVIPQRVL